MNALQTTTQPVTTLALGYPAAGCGIVADAISCSSLPVQGLPSLNSESTEPALGDNGERVVPVVPVRLPEWTSDVPLLNLVKTALLGISVICNAAQGRKVSDSGTLCTESLSTLTRGGLGVRCLVNRGLHSCHSAKRNRT